MQRFIFLFKKHLGIIFNNILYPMRLTCHPNQPQKSRLKIFAENIAWALHFYHANEFYYLLGFDIKGNKQYRQKYINAIKCFELLNRKKKQLSKDYKLYDIVIHDKFIAAQYMESLGFPTPKTIAQIANNCISFPKSGKQYPISILIKGKINLFSNCICKPVGDYGGEGVFRLQMNDRLTLMNNKKIQRKELYNMFVNRKFIVQEKVIQHKKMSALNPRCVNTIRLVTYWDHDEIKIFAAAVRIGTKGSITDNWHTGGIIVRLDIYTGRLGKNGFTHPQFDGKIFEKHPETNIVFNDYEIPYFKKAFDLAKKIHKYFYNTYTIGWDIAITPRGPVFIEGNQQWDPYVHIVLEDNFMDKFLKIIS